MRAISRGLLVTTLVLALAGTAGAAELFTAPLVSAIDRVKCFAVNVSGAARDVVLEVKNFSGVTVASASSTGLLALPSGAVFVVIPNPNTFDGEVYCKVTVAGGKNTVRATLCTVDDAGNCVASSDAR